MGRGGRESLNDIERVALDTLDDLSALAADAEKRSSQLKSATSGLVYVITDDEDQDTFCIYRNGDQDYLGSTLDDLSFILTNTSVIDNPNDLVTLKPSGEWMEQIVTAGTRSILPSALGDVVIEDEYVPLKNLVLTAGGGALNKPIVMIEATEDDWFGLYKDGTLVLQGHCHDHHLPDLLEALNIPHSVGVVSALWQQQLDGIMPLDVSEVTFKSLEYNPALPKL